MLSGISLREFPPREKKKKGILLLPSAHPLSNSRMPANAAQPFVVRNSFSNNAFQFLANLECVIQTSDVCNFTRNNVAKYTEALSWHVKQNVLHWN